MIDELWITIAGMVSALMLTACQTPASYKQTDQVIDMPIPTVSVDSDGDGVNDELDVCPNTQENAVVDARGCHITTGFVMSLKMETRVFFAKGSSEISPQYYSQLNNVGKKMLEFDTAIMRVEGNVSKKEIEDSSLTSKSNMLAKYRAMIVKNYLIMNYKIAPERITTFNCSARAPIASNDTQEGRAMNRRVYGIVTRTDENVYDSYEKHSESTQCIRF